MHRLKDAKRVTLFCILAIMLPYMVACCCTGGMDDDDIDLNLVEPDLVYPVAVISAAPSAAADMLDVAFDAGASNDTDGTIEQYDWDFDNDGIFDLLNGGPSASHTYPAAGEYSAAVRVTDNDGLSDTATTSPFTVPAAPPEAAGSGVQDTENPLTGVFDASDSFDSDGTIVRWDWDMDNDGEFELSDAGPEPSHTFGDYGTHTVGVRVTDDDGLTDETTINVTLTAPVEDLPPTAVLSADPESGNAPGLAVEFDASASSDSDGTIERYDWDMDGDGTFEITDGEATQSATYDAGGVYPVAVQVTDDDGLTDTAGVDVDVNEPPVAELTAEPGSGVATLAVEYDASASTDSDGTIERYDWDMDNDGTFEVEDGGATQSASYDTAGTYTVAVQVTDDDGAAASVSADVDVATPNQPPVAVLEATPSGGVYPLTVTLNGSASYDPDGSVTDFEWDFDGNGVFNEPGDEEDARNDPGPHLRTYDTAGTYNVDLRVTDDGTPGLTDPTSQVISVAEPNDTFSITVNITMNGLDDYILSPATLVRIYHGDPENGGVPFNQYNADHVAAGDGMPATVVFENLSPDVDYWFRMQNTVLWHDGDPEPEAPGFGMIKDYGPVTIPPDQVLDFSGVQWREPPVPV